MQRLVLFLGIVLFGATPAIDMHDVMPAFWSAWDATANASVQQRVSALRDGVVTPNMTIYGFSEFSKNITDDGIARYIERVEPLIPAMRTLSDRVESQLPAVLPAIQTQLPDLSLDGVHFYILPSFLHFEGQTHDLGDGLAIMFGVDQIAKYVGPNANVGVNIAHEVFHRYQYQHGFHSNAAVWEAVWIEGSAAYASQHLTPGATENDALDPGLPSTPPDQVAKLACLVKANWSSSSADAAAQFIDLGDAPPGLPANGGYLIGYLAAADAAKTLTIAQIGSLPIPQAEQVLRTTVNRLCP